MKSRGDLLFEIGCEEIPAGMIEKASVELRAIISKKLSEHNLVDEPTTQASVETFGAPRRLVAIGRNIRLKQNDVTREVLGPPKAIAFDPQGQPTRAATSFAEKQNVPLAKLSIVKTPKGEFLANAQLVKGRLAASVLREILPSVIGDLTWPRSMYWTGAHGPRFIRPVRWIVALLDGKVIPFTFADVSSGNRTEGHRFLGKSKIPVTGPRDYEAKLKKNFVLCRDDQRKRKVELELQSIARMRSLSIIQDEGLLKSVTYLNEYPTVIAGDFDPAFLALPEEVLVTVMRDHQKYFALQSRDGDLAPHFLATVNMPRDTKGIIRAGHERVLRARFADAQFFWNADQKIPLGGYLPKLSSVTYERRLGSYGDKVERMRALARWLSEQWFSGGVAQADVAGSDRAAELSKCDLITDMVREFTELQGIVGGLYARAQGEPEEIALAVYDQYKPIGIGDPIPRNLTGCAVAVADKLDSLVACFAVGAIPTGSSDPFALRRAALGVVKIILEEKIPLSISAAVSAAAKGLKDHAPRLETSDGVQRQVIDFLLERAKYMLRETNGFASDEIDAAFAAGADDLVDAADRVGAIHSIRQARNFPALAAAFKRIRNILEKSVSADDRGQLVVTSELLLETPEMQLHTASARIAEEARKLKKEKKYRKALEKISELRPAVDLFFDKVQVIVEDDGLRRNRIALLANLLKEFSTIGDFSLLATDGG